MSLQTDPSKAHNLFLDTALSVGILGLLVYILLWGFFLKLTVGSAFSGIEAVAIAYLVYTLTWYESAQFSHLPWWALSVGLGSPRNLTLSCQLGNRSTTDSDYDPDAG